MVGTCRLIFERSICRLGRMAVEERSRRLGVGKALIALAEEVAKEGGAERIVLHAQRRAETFYASCGYEAFGGTFEEEGIAHVMMRRPLAGRDPAP